MLGVHLSYKTPSSWKILFWYWGCLRQFSYLKNFRSLKDLCRVCHMEIIIQEMQLRHIFNVTGQSFLIIKGDITGASIHVSRQKNSPYRNKIRRSIYKTRRPKHPHLTTRLGKTTSREPCFTAPLHTPLLCHLAPSSPCMPPPQNY